MTNTTDDAATAARAGELARSVFLARDLVNTPANDLGPAELEAAIQGVLADVDQHGGDAGIGQAHGDASTHGAGADDRGRTDGFRRHGGEAGDLPHLALGEEDVAQGQTFPVLQ